MAKQKRSENTYTKINTLFCRDENNLIMVDSISIPELEWMKDCKFDATEKVDGTNIRIEVHRYNSGVIYDSNDEDTYVPFEITWAVKYRGKTDNANLPPHLLDYLQSTYPEEKVLAALGLKKVMSVDDELTVEKGWVSEENVGGETKKVINDKAPYRYTLYGEGYGAKIQKCGGRYISNGVSFIGFDVKVDQTYLLRENMLEIFDKLQCPTVPYIGQMTIGEAIKYVENGFLSNVAEDKTFLAEGLVLKTPHELQTRRGDRIIFKLKTCDFQKLKNR